MDTTVTEKSCRLANNVPRTIEEARRGGSFLHENYMQNTPRSGFLGATGSLLPVFSRRTGGQAASGTQTGGVKIESISCRNVSIALVRN